MDYTQLAQAKAEKKYPYHELNPEINNTLSKYTIDTERQAYIEALNDVNGLYDAAKAVITGKNNRFTSLRKIALLEAAIEQFEKI